MSGKIIMETPEPPAPTEGDEPERWGPNWEAHHPEALDDLCEDYADGGLDTYEFVRRAHLVVADRMKQPSPPTEEQAPEPVAWITHQQISGSTRKPERVAGMGFITQQSSRAKSWEELDLGIIPLFTHPPAPSDGLREALEEITAKLIEAQAEASHGHTANAACIDQIVDAALVIARTTLDKGKTGDTLLERYRRALERISEHEVEEPAQIAHDALHPKKSTTLTGALHSGSKLPHG